MEGRTRWSWLLGLLLELRDLLMPRPQPLGEHPGVSPYTGVDARLGDPGTRRVRRSLWVWRLREGIVTVGLVLSPAAFAAIHHVFRERRRVPRCLQRVTSRHTPGFGLGRSMFHPPSQEVTEGIDCPLSDSLFCLERRDPDIF